MYKDTAIAVTLFRIREVENSKKVTHCERTVDTWVKVNGIWNCVAAAAVAVPSKPAAD